VQVADDGVVEGLDPGPVQADVVRGPADAEGAAAGGQLPDEVGQPVVVAVAAGLQAVVAGGTPSDLRKFTGGRLVPQFLGAKLQEKPELFALASPIVHVTPGDAPMFLYHGGGDTLVDLSHAEDLKRALDEAKVRAELRVVPVLGHVLTFMLARGTEDEAMDFLAGVLARE